MRPKIGAGLSLAGRLSLPQSSDSRHQVSYRHLEN